MKVRSRKMRRAGVGAHMVNTEAQSLDEACDLILEAKRKPYRPSQAKRNLVHGTLLGVSMVSSKPVTLPKITMKEVKW